MREQRRRIERVLKKNPGFKSQIPDAIAGGYADGRDRAVADTNLEYATFPESCPYTFEQMMTQHVVFEK